MVDFRKALSPEARARLAEYERQQAEAAALTNRELAAKARHCLANCAPPRHQRGEFVYDAVLWHVLLPQLIARLEAAPDAAPPPPEALPET